MFVSHAQFAATACTIVSGAIAERARVEAYVIYSFFMAAWVYPVVIHSIWSGAGWASMFRFCSFPISLRTAACSESGLPCCHVLICIQCVGCGLVQCGSAAAPCVARARTLMIEAWPQAWHVFERSRMT